GMDALVEIHHDRELEVALAADDAVIGVNHRDLDTLEIDLGLSARLRDRIPSQRITVAESGVSSSEQVARLVGRGYENFLIGEHLARHDAPASALRSLRAVGPG
ncbi:MAG: indole-3-glycerol-phosphate synthase TrpC, partial [Myxococcota bacterium]